VQDVAVGTQEVGGLAAGKTRLFKDGDGVAGEQGLGAGAVRPAGSPAPAAATGTTAATITRSEPRVVGRFIKRPATRPAATDPAAAPTPPRRLTARPWKFVRSREGRSPPMTPRPVDHDRVTPNA